MNRVVLRKRYISLYEVREALESRIRSQVKLVDIHERTWSYLSIFGAKSGMEARRTLENLKKLGLSDEVATNLVNICPESEGEVRSILAMEREIAYDAGLINDILAILKKLCSS